MKISVVIPTCNRRELVLQAVESVVRQTWPAHEIIVIDDGGDDGTADAVSSRYANVEVHRQPNLGSALAKNTGVVLATGDWIAFLDDDDLWHPQKLRITQEYLAARPGCDALASPCWYFADQPHGPSEHLAIRRHFVAGGLDECVREADARGLGAGEAASDLEARCRDLTAILRRDQGPITSGLAVRRETLLRAGGFSPMHVVGEDWAMMVNVARLADWQVLPWRLAFYRFHGVQTTSAGPGDELQSLAGFINAWLTGRPMRDRTKFDEVLTRLAEFGPAYRRIVQGFIWAAVRRGDLTAAVALHRAGSLLLPRRRDRMYAVLPPPLTWRFERYILGMHK